MAHALSKGDNVSEAHDNECEKIDQVPVAHRTVDIVWPQLTGEYPRIPVDTDELRRYLIPVVRIALRPEQQEYLQIMLEPSNVEALEVDIEDEEDEDDSDVATATPESPEESMSAGLADLRVNFNHLRTIQSRIETDAFVENEHLGVQIETERTSAILVVHGRTQSVEHTRIKRGDDEVLMEHVVFELFFYPDAAPALLDLLRSVKKKAIEQAVHNLLRQFGTRQVRQETNFTAYYANAPTDVTSIRVQNEGTPEEQRVPVRVMSTVAFFCELEDGYTDEIYHQFSRDVLSEEGREHWRKQFFPHRTDRVTVSELTVEFERRNGRPWPNIAFRTDLDGQSRLYSTAEAILLSGVGLQLMALYKMLFGDDISRFQFEKQKGRLKLGDSNGGVTDVGEKIQPLPDMPVRFPRELAWVDELP